MSEGIDCWACSVLLRSHHVDVKKNNLRKQNQKAGIKHTAAKAAQPLSWVSRTKTGVPFKINNVLNSNILNWLFL